MSRKIAIIGAGSVYSPELVTEFFKGDKIKFDCMSLMDINERRLGIVGGLVQRMARRQNVKAKVELTTSLAQAVKGAQFVISQIRVGGNEARALDERIPGKYDVIGQETTGPGGMFKALRTIPPMVKVAQACRKLTPRAWILDFANPVGLVTEGVCRAVPGTRIVGVCSIQIGREHWVDAKVLGVSPKRIRVKSAGLNHLSWVYRIMVDGRDVTDRYFARLKKSSGWPIELLKAIKMIPVGYLWYYYFPEKMLPHSKGRKTRAIEVLRIEKILLKRYADPKLDEPPKELQMRGGSGYSAAMIAIMRGLTGDAPLTIPTNVPSRGAVPGFTKEQVLEIPCRINAHGIRPLSIPDGELPPHLLGLTHRVKAYETLTAQAALSGCYDTALAAMVTHPLVPSVSVARKILDEMLKAHRKYLPQFR